MGGGDAAAAAALFTPDAVLEDMALRSRMRGRLAIERSLGRALGTLPYGAGVIARHVVGSNAGGGFEWTATTSEPDARPLWGMTALALDEGGGIAGMTTTWDGDRLEDGDFGALARLLSSRPPECPDSRRG
jgi:hypothetical protein